MKSITIRELHEATGKWVRRAAASGGLSVTERGRPVARIIPERAPVEGPYFARRKLLPEYRRAQPFLTGGTDSTAAIAADRDRAES